MTDAELREKAEKLNAVARSLTVREHLLDSLTLLQAARSYFYRPKVSHLATMLRLGSQYPSRRKRLPMTEQEMNDLVRRWVDALAGLLTSHTREEFDRADFQTDDLLQPVLASPVRQLREFSRKVAAAIEQDPRIPFWCVQMFDFVVRHMLALAADGQPVELKEVLAAEVARLVTPHIAPELESAVAGALKWREAATLEKTKAAVQAGAKPRLKGRESCLFVEVDTPEGETVSVML